jgi:hypothetical protein
MTVTSRTSGPGDSRNVAAGEGDAKPFCQFQESLEQFIDLDKRGVGGEHERKQRKPGGRSHGGDVAHVDRERLVTDIGRGREAPIEMNAFDQRVGGQDLQRPAIRDRDRCVVADTDDQGRVGGRHPAANPFNQGTLAGLGNPVTRRATGRTQRRASP